jgi:endonuclease-3 related protein
MGGTTVALFYRELVRLHGRPAGQWSLWCKRPKTGYERQQVMIEAILTQRTNWRNVELAVSRMHGKGIRRLGTVPRISLSVLRECVRPAGFFRAKSRYLRSLAMYAGKNGGVRGRSRRTVSELRQPLLDLPGIGPETADSILLYALDKPVFVIDEYTRRLLKRKKMQYRRSYSELQQLFEQDLRKDFRLYQDFHALIVIDGKKGKRKI